MVVGALEVPIDEITLSVVLPEQLQALWPR